MNSTRSRPLNLALLSVCIDSLQHILKTNSFTISHLRSQLLFFIQAATPHDFKFFMPLCAFHSYFREATNTHHRDYLILHKIDRNMTTSMPLMHLTYRPNS